MRKYLIPQQIRSNERIAGWLLLLCIDRWCLLFNHTQNVSQKVKAHSTAPQYECILNYFSFDSIYYLSCAHHTVHHTSLLISEIRLGRTQYHPRIIALNVNSLKLCSRRLSDGIFGHAVVFFCSVIHSCSHFFSFLLFIINSTILFASNSFPIYLECVILTLETVLMKWKSSLPPCRPPSPCIELT